jgi:hypothetical protein
MLKQKLGNLSRRPQKASSGHHMKVQMVHALPRPFAVVGNQAEIFEVKLLGQLFGNQQNMPQQSGVFFIRFA